MGSYANSKIVFSKTQIAFNSRNLNLFLACTVLPCCMSGFKRYRAATGYRPPLSLRAASLRYAPFASLTLAYATFFTSNLLLLAANTTSLKAITNAPNDGVSKPNAATGIAIMLYENAQNKFSFMVR